MQRYVLTCVLCVVASPLFAQSNPAAAAARGWRQQHERAIVDEFAALLSLPNIAKDRDAIRRNADAIAAMMSKRGLSPRLLTVPGGNPVVVGEIHRPGAARTLAFYAHYDGQPLDPAEWASPPFEPVLRTRSLADGGVVVALPEPGTPFDPESRLYARSTSDDKAAIVALMTALDALHAARRSLTSNVTLVFDGEEETGSPNLERTIAEHKDLFAADLWLMCDGPVYQNGQQSVVFGVRGITTIDVTLYGPRVELHSGHYGNWAPNPAMSMARLLTSMKDEHGHVLVDGFYEGIEPLGEMEKRAIAESPDVEPALMKKLWLGSTEGAPRRLADLLALPSLNIRGMASGRVGDKASNVIPATATATIDVRLVKGMDRLRTSARLVDHIRKQGFFVVDTDPDAATRTSHPLVAKVTVDPGGYNAVRTPMDLPIARDVVRAVEGARGPAVKVPSMGGSLPLENIVRPLGTHTIVIPIANYDNNQHGANENIRIQNLWDGIELMAALLTM